MGCACEVSGKGKRANGDKREEPDGKAGSGALAAEQACDSPGEHGDGYARDQAVEDSVDGEASDSVEIHGYSRSFKYCFKRCTSSSLRPESSKILSTSRSWEF